MALLDIFLGDRADLRAAAQELAKQEDRVFRRAQGELTSLATHVISDISRFETINARQRLGALEAARRADRNLVVTIFGFAFISAKLFGCFDFLIKLFQTLGTL